MREEILIPFFVCVLLPVSIVLIVSLRKRNSDNKRADVLIKAIESGREVDTERLVESLRSTNERVYTAKDILYARLLRGCIFSLIGVALTIVYFTGLILREALLLTTGLICLAVGIAYLIVYFVSRNDILNEK